MPRAGSDSPPQLIEASNACPHAENGVLHALIMSVSPGVLPMQATNREVWPGSLIIHALFRCLMYIGRSPGSSGCMHCLDNLRLRGHHVGAPASIPSSFALVQPKHMRIVDYILSSRQTHVTIPPFSLIVGGSAARSLQDMGSPGRRVFVSKQNVRAALVLYTTVMLGMWLTFRGLL